LSAFVWIGPYLPPSSGQKSFMDNDNNDNDKRLGLTAKADKPDHKKYSTPKIKTDNEAVQKLQTN